MEKLWRTQNFEDCFKVFTSKSLVLTHGLLTTYLRDTSMEPGIFLGKGALSEKGCFDNYFIYTSSEKKGHHRKYS